MKSLNEFISSCGSIRKLYWLLLSRLFYLFINYNTITNYILIIYELSNIDHLLGVVSQTRVSGGNRTHGPHTNSLAHYPLDYQGTQQIVFCLQTFLILTANTVITFSIWNKSSGKKSTVIGVCRLFSLTVCHGTNCFYRVLELLLINVRYWRYFKVSFYLLSFFIELCGSQSILWHSLEDGWDSLNVRLLDSEKLR